MRCGPPVALALLMLMLTMARPVVARAEEAAKEPDPVTLEATYAGDVIGVVHGGRARGVRYVDVAELTLAVDLDRAISWRGATLFVDWIGNQGGAPRTLVGDVQGVDNIAAPNGFRLYEAWLEQVVLGRRVSLLTGFYDVSSEIDFLKTAQIFLHSSHGTGAELGLSGRRGPSIYPSPSLAVRAKARLAPGLVAQAMVADGTPGDPRLPSGSYVTLEGDALLMAEVSWLRGETVKRGVDPVQRERRARRRRATHEGVTAYRTKIAFGTWAYTTAREDLLPGVSSQHRLEHGTYGEIDTRLFSEPGRPVEGLSAYARAGFADPRVDAVAAYTGGGAVYTGLLPGRSRDRAGTACAVAYPSSRLDSARTEIDLELTYLAHVLSWLDVQLDLQYVVAPGMSSSTPDAVVVGARSQLSF